MNIKELKCINSTDMLESFLEKIETVTDNTQLLAYIGTSVLEFKEKSDKSKQPKLWSLSEIFGIMLTNTGAYPTKDEIVEFITSFITSKTLYKVKLNNDRKDKAVYGGRHTKEYLESKIKEIELNTSLLLRPNKHDRELFNHFKQCGSSLVLVNNNEILLCIENARGEIRINPKYFLKGQIAEQVKWNFDEKIKIYYKKLQEFLVELVDIINEGNEDEQSLSPIEDYIFENLPTSISKYFNIIAVEKSYETTEGKKIKKITYLDHYECKLKKEIGEFSEIFNYTLQNWTKFYGRIDGQNEFLAWTNDKLETAASYYPLPKENEVTVCPKHWDEFLNTKFENDNHLRMRFESYIGMILDASNRCQQYLIISDKGGTGKDFFSRILRKILPSNCFSDVDISMLNDTDRFGLSGIEVWKSHVSIIHEITENNYKNLMSAKAKQFFAQNNMSLEIKNGGMVDWNPINHKTIVFSNKKISIKEPANRRRAIPITFNKKLAWSQDYEDNVVAEAEDFLKYCYHVYKTCPMVNNGQYIVLSAEDEKKYINGELELNNENWEKLSKAAFAEECLKEYYNTDEYTETDEALDIYEPICDALFDFNDPEAYITSPDMAKVVKEHIMKDKSLILYFNAKQIGDQIELNTYGNNTTWYKFINYIKDKKDVVKKKKCIDGKTFNCYVGVSLKTNNSINDICFDPAPPITKTNIVIPEDDDELDPFIKELEEKYK